MTDKVKSQLDKVFKIPVDDTEESTEIVVEEVEKQLITHNESRDVDVSDDYKKRREVLYDLIEKGTEALETSLKVAKGTQHPRNFEVTGQLIKTMADVSKDLTDLQQSMDKLEGVEKEGGGNAGGNVTNNAIFVGSTDELMRALQGETPKVIDG